MIRECFKVVIQQVTDHQNLHIRTFYTYDKNKALIEEICDNGRGMEAEDLIGVTKRTIKKIIPRTEGTGIGLPVVEAYYGYDLSTGREKFISRVVNHYKRIYL